MTTDAAGATLRLGRRPRPASAAIGRRGARVSSAMTWPGCGADVDENWARGRDERVTVREFDESVEYTYRLLKSMSRSD